MLRAFAEYIIGLKREETVVAAGNTYSTSDLTRLDKEEFVDPIQVRSLSGLVDYIKSNFDHERELMVHVASPTTVRVFDSLNRDNDRRTYISAQAMLPEIQFERYLNRENFNVMLQACFVDSIYKGTVLKFVSSIIEENSVAQNDDGISQRVTAKTGIATRGEVDVPNPVSLKPFRTFVEVAQPESEFVLRLREGGQVGLFEADGGAWELNAMANIKGHLESELEGLIELGAVIIVA